MDKKINELQKKIAKLEKELERGKKEEKGDGKEKKEKKTFIPMKILYSWEAPSRIFVPRDKAWFLKVAAVALLFVLFFAFLQDFIVILVICVMVLVTFLLASIPPDKVEHQITSKGIISIDVLYRWKDLKDFWVAEKFGYKVVYIKTKIEFPSRLMLVIKAKEEMKIVGLLLDKLEFAEYSKKQDWLSKVADGTMINPERYLKSLKRKRNKKDSKTSSS
jgi:hypothetical protein